MRIFCLLPVSESDFRAYCVPTDRVADPQLSLLIDKVKTIAIDRKLCNQSDYRNIQNRDPNSKKQEKKALSRDVAVQNYKNSLIYQLKEVGFTRQSSLFQHPEAPSWLIHVSDPWRTGRVSVGEWGDKGTEIDVSFANDSNTILRPAMGAWMKEVIQSNDLFRLTIPQEYLIPLTKMPQSVKPHHRFAVVSERVLGRDLNAQSLDLVPETTRKELCQQICTLIIKSGYIDANLTNFLLIEEDGDWNISIIDTEPFGVMAHLGDPMLPAYFKGKEIVGCLSVAQASSIGLKEFKRSCKEGKLLDWVEIIDQKLKDVQELPELMEKIPIKGPDCAPVVEPPTPSRGWFALKVLFWLVFCFPMAIWLLFQDRS